MMIFVYILSWNLCIYFFMYYVSNVPAIPKVASSDVASRNTLHAIGPKTQVASIGHIFPVAGKVSTISAYLFRPSGTIVFQILRPVARSPPTMCHFNVWAHWKSPVIKTEGWMQVWKEFTWLCDFWNLGNDSKNDLFLHLKTLPHIDQVLILCVFQILGSNSKRRQI